MNHTQSLIITAPHQVELREIEVPALQPGEVRIRTSHTLLSMGTEISLATGQRTENARFPFVPGYQGIGRIDFMTPHAKEITALYPTGHAGPFWDGERGLRQSQMKAAAVRLAARGVFQAGPYLSHVAPVAKAADAYRLAMSDQRQQILGMVFDW